MLVGSVNYSGEQYTQEDETPPPLRRTRHRLESPRRRDSARPGARCPSRGSRRRLRRRHRAADALKAITTPPPPRLKLIHLLALRFTPRSNRVPSCPTSPNAIRRPVP